MSAKKNPTEPPIQKRPPLNRFGPPVRIPPLPLLNQAAQEPETHSYAASASASAKTFRINTTEAEREDAKKERYIIDIGFVQISIYFSPSF